MAVCISVWFIPNAMKRILVLSCLLISIATPTFAADAGHKIKIILIGDSTTADRTGWGLGFKQFVDTNRAECINLAVLLRGRFPELDAKLLARATATIAQVAQRIEGLMAAEIEMSKKTARL